MNVNCWEYHCCGREPGGAHVSESGLCPAATDRACDGLYGGTNAGRACWLVAGTLCGGTVQGSLASKLTSCFACEFLARVMDDEGWAASETGPFVYESARAAAERLAMHNAILRAAREVHNLALKATNLDDLIAPMMATLVRIGGFRVTMLWLWEKGRSSPRLWASPDHVLDDTQLPPGPPACSVLSGQEPGTCIEIDEGRCRACTFSAVCRPGTVHAVSLPVSEAAAGLLIATSPCGLAGSDRQMVLEGLAADVAEVTAHVWGRAQLERQRGTLARTDRLATLGLLAAGLAHELANPLTCLAVSLDELQTVCALLEEEDERWRGALNDAQDATNRITQVLSDVRAATRPQADVQAIRVEAAMEKALAVARHQLKHVVKVHVDLAETPPVRCSEGHMVQVFLNLIVNAAQAMSGQDREAILTLKTTTRGGMVEAEVADTGPGIPEDQLSDIFEPFFTTKPKEVGTGLGLAICRDLVKREGGSIEVASTVGEGTTVRVRLPVA